MKRALDRWVSIILYWIALNLTHLRVHKCELGPISAPVFSSLEMCLIFGDHNFFCFCRRIVSVSYLSQCRRQCCLQYCNCVSLGWRHVSLRFIGLLCMSTEKNLVGFVERSVDLHVNFVFLNFNNGSCTATRLVSVEVNTCSASHLRWYWMSTNW